MRKLSLMRADCAILSISGSHGPLDSEGEMIFYGCACDIYWTYYLLYLDLEIEIGRRSFWNAGMHYLARLAETLIEGRDIYCG